MTQRSSIFSSESLPELGLDRARAPWGLVVACILLALVEFGVARRDFVWAWVPHSDPGVVDALERKVLVPNEAGEGPQVVFFGNSRMRDGVAPRILEERLALPEGSVMNLALTRGSAFDSEMLYRRNRPLLSQARLAIFGVDVIQLDGALGLNERVRRFANLGDRLTRFEGSERIELLVGWFWRSYDARDALRRLVKSAWQAQPKGLPLTEDGRVEWRTAAVNRRASRRSMRSFAKQHFRRYKRSESRRLHLREFVQLLESDGLEVVVVQVPVRSDYASEARRRYPTHLMQYEDDILRSVGDRIVRIWWDAEFVGLRKRHFHDYGHLRDSGTIVFTNKIAAFIEDEFPDLLTTMPQRGSATPSRRPKFGTAAVPKTSPRAAPSIGTRAAVKAKQDGAVAEAQ